VLSIRDLSFQYGETTVLRDINLDIAPGEIVCLLGPSGCGKTTLLRIIAGLETGHSGTICYEEQNIDLIPVHQRRFGLMFQDFALFPHMTVAENIIFGMRMQGKNRQEQQERLAEILNLVELNEFEDRRVTTLSGGERQRVALARSLAPHPRLLMLDEPFSSLDAALKDQLLVEMRRIIKQIGLTAIYVTHDQHEAFRIADRVVVMRSGQIEQVASPEAIYRQPETEFVARFLGLTNIVGVQRVEASYAHTSIGEFPVSGDPAAILIHPDGIKLAKHTESDDILHGTIRKVVYTGDTYQIDIVIKESIYFSFKVGVFQLKTLPLPGDTITIQYDADLVTPLQAS
jgi:putative spermidine/putrescine transport system ATP-binding protein